METITALFSFLEKHLSWKCMLSIICIAVSFCLGFICNDAARDKQEANLIISHAREITAYQDSALSAKHEAHDAVNTYKWMMFYQNRTIDSLKYVIKLMNDENKD